MAEDLQGLLERINRDGVEKARAEADAITSAAKAKAAEIVRKANEDAEAARATAKSDAEAYAQRAAETVRQAARDVVLRVGDSVRALLENVLAKDVDKALADEAVAAALAAEAVKGLASPAEVAAPAKLVPALKAQLAAQGNVKVVLDEALDAGFSVSVENGRVEHSFTPEVIAAELAKRLRPDLAALLK